MVAAVRCYGCRRALLGLQACERVSTALRHMPELEFQKRIVPARSNGGGIGDLGRRLARAFEAVAERPVTPVSPPGNVELPRAVRRTLKRRRGRARALPEAAV